MTDEKYPGAKHYLAMQEPVMTDTPARALIEAYFSAVFEMVDPKIFADDLMECLSAKGYKIVAREPTEDMEQVARLVWEKPHPPAAINGAVFRAMWDAAP